MQMTLIIIGFNVLWLSSEYDMRVVAYILVTFGNEFRRDRLNSCTSGRKNAISKVLFYKWNQGHAHHVYLKQLHVPLLSKIHLYRSHVLWWQTVNAPSPLLAIWKYREATDAKIPLKPKSMSYCI